MTDHPLTDEVIHREFLPKFCYRENDLRAAADWQLERVIEWLRDTHEEHIGLLAVIKDLREAMRPTQEDKR